MVLTKPANTGGDARSNILEAAWDLAAEQGYEAVTMRNIAKAAGVGKSTLYRYYTTKEQLYWDVTFEWGSHFAEQLEQRRPQGEVIGERVAFILAEVVREALRHPNLFSAYVASLLSDSVQDRKMNTRLDNLMPGLLTIAMGERQSCHQHLASSVLGHLLMSSMQLMSAGLQSEEAAIIEMTETARLLLSDVWGTPFP